MEYDSIPLIKEMVIILTRTIKNQSGIIPILYVLCTWKWFYSLKFFRIEKKLNNNGKILCIRGIFYSFSKNLKNVDMSLNFAFFWFCCQNDYVLLVWDKIVFILNAFIKYLKCNTTFYFFNETMI